MSMFPFVFFLPPVAQCSVIQIGIRDSMHSGRDTPGCKVGGRGRIDPQGPGLAVRRLQVDKSARVGELCQRKGREEIK